MKNSDPELPDQANLRKPALWAALGHRDFAFLWAGGISMSITGVLRTLVSGQWLYDTTGSPALLGMLGAVQLLQLPVGLYGGTLSDRINRKKLMVMTQGVAFTMLFFLGKIYAFRDR